MRVLLMTAMMLCACLSVPGCTGGEQEEIICEDGGVLTQYDSLYCDFEIRETPEGEECGGPDGEFYVENLCYGSLRIEMTNTGDTPVQILTFHASYYEDWMNCVPIPLEDGLYADNGSMGTTLEGALPGSGSFVVAFDHPNSCDDEETSDIVELSFKVSRIT